MSYHFNKYATEGNNFFKTLAKALGNTEDIPKAGRTIKSVLHALRNQLAFQESLQLIAQFPMFLKAVYVHEWKPETKNKPKKVDDFINEIRRIHGSIAKKDFANDDEIENAIVVCFIILRKYISLGELEDIRSVLPKDLKPLLNSVLMI